ncbi:MAG: DUF3300 domain-containing protein [Acidobacteriota bacterium]
MKRTITFCLLSCLIANVTLAAQAATRRATKSYQPHVTVPQGALSAEQMDNLLAPIALYPDPLLAQVFPASTFVDQIDQAARWLRGNNNNSAGVDNQPWDVSVRSVAHYPQVVYMMSDKLDWTTALGQAYVNQSTDVITSVQRLRARAKAAGYLVTTPQQVVIVEKEVIKIVPAQPQVIYVPTYNPQVVYVQTGPSTGQVVAAAAISFGVGLAIGAWLNNDVNWYSHTVFYHGWHGVGWVSTSSRYVHVNSVYVNNRYSTVHVNSAVVHRNVNYNNINHYNNVNRNVNYNNVNVSNVNRNNVNVNNVNRNNVNTNNVNRNTVNNNNLNRNINTSNQNLDQYRGRTAQASTANRAAQQPAQRPSAFGGYGNRSATMQQSQRGQMSRTSMSRPQATRSAPSRGGGGRRR